MSETMALATPPYPAPLRHKAGLLRRFVIGWGSWIHTLFEKSYRMKMGTVRFPLLRFFVINDLALVQDVLEEKRCPWPKHGLMTELLRPLMGQSVFSANGAQWQAQRAMINPAFAHAGLGRASAMRAAADAMAEQLHRAATQGPVDMERP
jgi:cytochrome P450